jgi:hypothetical protein
MGKLHASFKKAKGQQKESQHKNKQERKSGIPILKINCIPEKQETCFRSHTWAKKKNG